MKFTGRGILLDIEGTTSSVSFVYDVMFPFVRRELDAYLETHWAEPELTAAVAQIAQDAGHDSLSAWVGENAEDQRKAVTTNVLELMDNDVKATGLKMLQGQIWKSGFESGELVAHVYDDVVPAIHSWKSVDCDVRIYSSGSVPAQRLFFGHTEQGDLLALLSAHYDTQVGSKRESSSYQTIVADFGLPAEEVLFLSDVVAELDAAKGAGLQTGWCVRPGNAPEDAVHDHPKITSFDQVVISAD